MTSLLSDSKKSQSYPGKPLPQTPTVYGMRISLPTCLLILSQQTHKVSLPIFCRARFFMPNHVKEPENYLVTIPSSYLLIGICCLFSSPIFIFYFSLDWEVFSLVTLSSSRFSSSSFFSLLGGFFASNFLYLWFSSLVFYWVKKFFTRMDKTSITLRLAEFISRKKSNCNNLSHLILCLSLSFV